MNELIYVPACSLAAASGAGWFCGYVVGRDVKRLTEMAGYGGTSIVEPKLNHGEDGCGNGRYREGYVVPGPMSMRKGRSNKW